MINNGYPASIKHVCDLIVRNNLITYVCAHCPRDYPSTIIDVEDRCWMCFFLFYE